MSGKEDEKLAGLLEQDFKMFQSLSDLIKRGQKLGEFRSGDSFEMAILFFSAIQGLTIFRTAFQPVFKMPAKALITSFLYNEERRNQ